MTIMISVSRNAAHRMAMRTQSGDLRMSCSMEMPFCMR